MARDSRPDLKNKDFNEAVYHRPPTGPSYLVIGVITAIILVILTYLAFAKSLPFGSEFQVTATFENPATIRPTSPVRIAGVGVGEVKQIELNGEVAEVTFSVDESALPLHADSEATIRPRLFLEGNFFIDLRPGSPGAEEMPDGGSIPITRTQTAVQLDEILTALQRPDRENLSGLLKGYGGALVDPPNAAEDATQDPSVQGESAAKALNDSFRYGGRAGKGSAQVAEAFRGESPGDLIGLVDATGVVFRKLASRESQLRQLIGNLAVTAGAFASESTALEETLAELAPTLEEAEPSLLALNNVFPPLRAFATAITPGVEELPATIDSSGPWLRQTRQLLAEDELKGIAKDLRIATPNLAAGTSALTTLLPEIQKLSRCTTKVLVPTGDIVVADDFATGASNFKEFFYVTAAGSGIGGNFDGNGQYLRAQVGGGPTLAQAPVPGAIGQNTPLWMYTIQPPKGGQPLPPSSTPPVRTDVRCDSNDIPNVNGPAGAAGAPTPAAP